MTRQIALGAFLPGGGVHGAGWRLPEVDVATSSSFDAFRRVAQRLEEGCFDTLSSATRRRCGGTR